MTNVVVFLTDQQRWDTMGLHGNPLELTPNLDRFAQHGTFCEYAFTNQPVCAPARACLQTGRWPTQTGVYRNGIPLPADATRSPAGSPPAGTRRCTWASGTSGRWTTRRCRDSCAAVTNTGSPPTWSS
jgi:arylsulfatase A-like enzyme